MRDAAARAGAAAALAAIALVAAQPARAAGPVAAVSQRGVSEQGTEVVLRALALLGVPYRWGGTRPESGLDCSGLVQHVFAELGLSVPRHTSELSRVGDRVDRGALRPGDLVFFNTLRRAFSHVGIYIGNGRFVHAPSSGAQVRVESMNVRYWRRRYNGARRLLPEDTARLLAGREAPGARAAGGRDTRAADAAQTDVGARTPDGDAALQLGFAADPGRSWPGGEDSPYRY